MIEILVGSKERVDFDNPVKMSTDQYQKFIKFLKTLFWVVEEEAVDEFRYERLGEKFFQMRWTPAEYEKLLEIEDTETLAHKLGRTWMSVNIQRGIFLPKFMVWADENGKDYLKGDTQKIIKEFMKTQEAVLKKRRAGRKIVRQLQKQLDEKKRILKLYSGTTKEPIKNLLKEIKELEDKIADETK